jgi:hypothetical protein
MKRLIFLIPLLALVCTRCATIDVDCPDDGTTTTAAIGGNTVGLQLLAMAQMAAKGAAFARNVPAAAATPVNSTSHVHYSYAPIFGSDYVSCAGHIEPASAPTPSIILVSPGPPASAQFVAPR